MEAGEVETLPPRVVLRFRSTSPDSVEALRRAAACADEYRDRLLEERFRDREILPTTRFLDVEATDLSTEGERERSRYAKFLPLLLVLLLLSGGSFIALDLVAGEKERGTLETLYVHPVPTDGIVWGKFLALLAGSLVCGFVNLAGLFGSLWIGGALGMAPRGLEGAGPLIPDPLTLAIVGLAVVPLVVMTSAALLVLSTVARSFREAQNYLLPLTLVVLALLLLAVAPGARLSSVVCIVPFAGCALAIREALEGPVPAIPLLVASSSAFLYGGLLLGKASALLRREDVLLDLEAPYSPEDAVSDARARRALAFSAFMLLFLYYAASWLQTAEFRADRPFRGVAITLWGFVLLPALVYPLLARVPYRETLGLRGAPARSFLLVPPLALAALVLVTAYMALQNQFLHAPRALDEVFRDLIGKADLGLLPALGLFAVSPGICEELLWRGAVQGELEPRRRPVRTAVTVGLLFGLFHLSVHRFVPTALLGALLAVVRHRSGSVIPCMLLHAIYNGTLVVLSRNEVAGGLPSLEDLVLHPLTLALAAICVPLCVLGIGGSGKGREAP
jgi:membrane protease YdiL (CAAX protease family)